MATDSLTKTSRPRRPSCPSGLNERYDQLLARLPASEEPARRGALDLERLGDEGRRLAAAHRLAARPGRDRLLGRLKEDARIIEDVYGLLAASAALGQTPPPAGRWLLENYYLVAEQIRMARRHLPRKYSVELPQLAEGRQAGLPRVYDLVLQLIGHVDGQIEQERLDRFVEGYQQSAHLRLGELWAVPIMLRLALIENVRCVAVRVARQRPAPEDAPQAHAPNAAAEANSIGNTITSIRAMGELDWKLFVETHSAVEHILSRDPAGIYPDMSFSTRDQYRHVVESLSRRSPLDEEEVARAVVAHALPPGVTCADPAGSKRRHVGYYLLDRGRETLQREIGYRPGWRERLRRPFSRRPLASYLGAVGLLWFALMVPAGWIAWRLAAGAEVAAMAVIALFAPAAAQFAIAVVNWLCALLVPPRLIPRLDFSEGIPRSCRTVVAIPTLLTGRRAVASLLDRLETGYLANRDGNLSFVLLTDFPDADRPELPGDEELLQLARSGIERLNARYGSDRCGGFYLLHRPRKWNPQEGVWMGEERKRGKLAALNRLLARGSGDDFRVTVGDVSRLRSAPFVITLDTDTQLPRDAGRELAGCLAHPLNRPVLDPRTLRVVEGYGILQPRVATPIPDAASTPFSLLFAGDAGIDPYTNQTSDLYQDLFGEGSFIGKGIYDVAAFEASLQGRFPDNRLLSHDLIEGCFARSGLVSDVLLFEGCPARLLADMSRRHRWIRGDWQIAAWLLPRVPSARGAAANSLSGLSRRKILDNLRRSLTPVFLFAFLALAWTTLPWLAGSWTVLLLLAVFVPPLLGLAIGFLCKPEEMPWRLHAKEQGANAARAAAREIVGLAVLPYTAHVHLDAVLRTLWRLCVSHRRLLEWTTAAEAERRAKASCRDHYELMWAGPLAALGLAALLAIRWPAALAAAGPLLALWLAGPLLAWWISQPHRMRTPHLSERETLRLRCWTRQTWHYFDVHTGRQNHWLPPDNVQHTTEWQVAPRTSPTNIGMGLLAELAACDLGYQGRCRLLERTGRMLQALEGLERYRGHFYNWYDTRTGQPALPRYVSSVDSGNLWGALIVLRVGLQELSSLPVAPPRLTEAVDDTLGALDNLRREHGSNDLPEFDAHLAELRRILAGLRAQRARQAHLLLDQLRHAARALLQSVPPANAVIRQWSRALVRQISSLRADVAHLAFWTSAGRPGDTATLGLEPQEEQALERLWARLEELDQACLLGEVPRAAAEVQETAAGLCATLSAHDRPARAAREELVRTLEVLARRARAAEDYAGEQLQRARDLALRCARLSNMDFRFLLRRKRKLLAIGCNLSQPGDDKSCYDLLASESRLTSFLAISHGQLPQEHWFRLGRLMAMNDGEPVLLSWSGSMFEYLMPMLVMPSYRGTLLDTACRAAVRRQIRYGLRQRVPWGVSESCCHEFDGGADYRYRAFGVPGLGLARGLAADLVVAPYASALAAIIAPREACANLETLERAGALGPYGFYDAVDYTPHRRKAGQPQVCRTVMAHHSGMALLALTRVLLGDVFPRRFLKDPLCRSHDLLLQERVPQAVRPVDPETLDMGPHSGKRAPRPK